MIRRDGHLSHTSATIRPYSPADLEALYDVCVRTAASGDDLTPLIGDARLPGHLYAAPYGVLQPQLAFVVHDDLGVGGYVVGTADTAQFERRLEIDWLPALRVRYPEGSAGREPDDRLISLLHHPPTQHADVLGDYPAHLHIDLLPRVRGQGLGRALIERFILEVARAGASGVHVGVNPANERAVGFYGRLGFEKIREDHVSIVLGRRLDRSTRASRLV